MWPSFFFLGLTADRRPTATQAASFFHRNPVVIKFRSAVQAEPGFAGNAVTIEFRSAAQAKTPVPIIHQTGNPVVIGCRLSILRNPVVAMKGSIIHRNPVFIEILTRPRQSPVVIEFSPSHRNSALVKFQVRLSIIHRNLVTSSIPHGHRVLSAAQADSTSSSHRIRLSIIPRPGSVVGGPANVIMMASSSSSGNRNPAWA